jgi:hypothetical protein
MVEGALSEESPKDFAVLNQLAEIFVVPTHQWITNDRDDGNPAERLRQRRAAFD